MPDNLEVLHRTAVPEAPEHPVVGTFDTGGPVGGFWPNRQQVSEVVSFAQPYNSRPGIPVALMSLELGVAMNPRVKCYSSNIKETRFEINIGAWAGTKVHQASCAWLVIEDNHPDFQFGTYSTEDDHSSRDPRMENTRKVDFSRPYAKKPEVVVWLSSIELHRDRNWRVKAYVTDVTKNGFTIHVDTSGNSQLNMAVVSWVSYTSGTPGVASGSIDTLGPRQSTQLSTSGYAKFGKNVFSLPPRTILGISSLDINCGTRLRLAVGTTSVHSAGMKWYLKTWGDTKLNFASASYIALS